MDRRKDGTEYRWQLDAENIERLIDLLRDICAKPADHLKNEVLISALRSQGALAKYSQLEPAIHAMSLNHQKAVSNLMLAGFELIDNLRRAAGDAIEAECLREKRGSKTTKAGLRTRVRELEAERIILLEELMLLQRAFDLRCLHAAQYAAKADRATRARCAKEQREIDASLSLRRRPTPVHTLGAQSCVASFRTRSAAQGRDRGEALRPAQTPPVRSVHAGTAGPGGVTNELVFRVRTSAARRAWACRP